MRTFAARERDLAESRYQADAEDTRHHDPSTAEGAIAILKSKGGKAAAQHALGALWRQANQPGEGYLPTAQIPAPLHVLRALQRSGLIKEADDERGRAIRFRLSTDGVQIAAQAAAAKGGAQ